MQCACPVLLTTACPAVQYFPTLSHKRHDFRKKKFIEHEMRVLIFCSTFVCNIAYCNKISARKVINANRVS